CRPLGRIALVDHRLIDIDELRAGPLAVLLVAEHPLGAVRREGSVVAPGRVRPAGRSEHRRPAREVGLIAHLQRREGTPFVVFYAHLYADLSPHFGEGAWRGGE